MQVMNSDQDMPVVVPLTKPILLIYTLTILTRTSSSIPYCIIVHTSYHLPCPFSVLKDNYSNHRIDKQTLDQTPNLQVLQQQTSQPRLSSDSKLRVLSKNVPPFQFLSL